MLVTTTTRRGIFGADETNRTSDLLITNQLLYQLSYISEDAYSSKKLAISARPPYQTGNPAVTDPAQLYSPSRDSW
jgi:hypothetical protein